MAQGGCPLAECHTRVLTKRREPECSQQHFYNSPKLEITQIPISSGPDEERCICIIEYYTARRKNQLQGHG